MLMINAYIGIGSNLETPLQQVRQALIELDAIPDTRCVQASPLYHSAPLGPSDQPDYINAVAAVTTARTPNELLANLQAIENNHHRVRKIHWGPRTLDLDLLLYDQLQQDDPHLTLPHPRMHERIFVLQPLYDIAPELHIPGRGSLTTLLKQCPPLPIEQIKYQF